MPSTFTQEHTNPTLQYDLLVQQNTQVKTTIDSVYEQLDRFENQSKFYKGYFDTYSKYNFYLYSIYYFLVLVLVYVLIFRSTYSFSFKLLLFFLFVIYPWVFLPLLNMLFDTITYYAAILKSEPYQKETSKNPNIGTPWIPFY